MSSKTNKETEKFTPKEIAILAGGILMCVAGSATTNYLTMFSKEHALENPLQGSIIAFCISLLFFGSLYYLIKKSIGSDRLFLIIVLSVPFLIFVQFYYSAIKYQPPQTDQEETVVLPEPNQTERVTKDG